MYSHMKCVFDVCVDVTLIRVWCGLQLMTSVSNWSSTDIIVSCYITLHQATSRDVAGYISIFNTLNIENMCIWAWLQCLAGKDVVDARRASKLCPSGVRCRSLTLRYRGIHLFLLFIYLLHYLTPWGTCSCLASPFGDASRYTDVLVYF